MLLHQPRLGGASQLVVTEEAGKPFGAVAVASPCGIELLGLKQALRPRSGEVGLDIERSGHRGCVTFGHLGLEARGQKPFVEVPQCIAVAECGKIHPAAAVPVVPSGESATYVRGQ